MLADTVAKSCSGGSSGIGPWLAIGVAVILAYLAFQRWRVGRRGIYIDRGHPLIVEATRKAQQSLDTLRRLHQANGDEVAVKFRVEAQDGSSELPWGSLLEIGASDFTAQIITPLMFVPAPASGRVTLPLEQLIDWQVELADGTIRGGFSTQAEIRISQQAGRRLPAYIAGMQGRFADH